jgi:hypothetical protein
MPNKLCIKNAYQPESTGFQCFWRSVPLDIVQLRCGNASVLSRRRPVSAIDAFMSRPKYNPRMRANSANFAAFGLGVTWITASPAGDLAGSVCAAQARPRLDHIQKK